MRADAREQDAWYLHLLVARSHPDGFLGLMFDFDFDDIQREGCAIFVEAIDNLGAGHPGLSDLLRSRTALHEIGHLLNLIHPPGSSQDLGLMTQTARLVRDPDWRQKIRFDYSSPDVQFRRDNPLQCKPGTSVRFRGSNQDEGADIPPSPISEAEVRLRLADGLEPDRFPLGKPLEVAIEIQNRGTEVSRIPAAPSIEAGTVIFEIEEIGQGNKRRICPPMVACGGSLATHAIGPGELITWTEWVFYDRAGFVIPRPGSYSLRAFVATEDPRAWLAAASLRIEVVRPRGVEPATLERLLDPEVGRYLYLRGAGHLRAAHRRVHALLRELEPGLLAAPLQACVSRVAKQRAFRRSGSPAMARRNIRQATEGLYRALEQERNRMAKGRWASELIEIHRVLNQTSEADRVRRSFEHDLATYRELLKDERQF